MLRTSSMPTLVCVSQPEFFFPMLCQTVAYAVLKHLSSRRAHMFLHMFEVLKPLAQRGPFVVDSGGQYAQLLCFMDVNCNCNSPKHQG